MFMTNCWQVAAYASQILQLSRRISESPDVDGAGPVQVRRLLASALQGG